VIVAGGQPGYEYNGGGPVFCADRTSRGFCFWDLNKWHAFRRPARTDRDVAKAKVSASLPDVRMRRCNIKDEGRAALPFVDFDPAKR
jgi:hypothetical protein